MNTDSQHRLVIIVACLGLAALACSDAFTGPSTIDLTGNWLLGYTDSDGAFTCHHDSVFLFFGDSTAMPRAVLLGSTAGYCVGSGRNDTLFLPGARCLRMGTTSGLAASPISRAHGAPIESF